MHETARRTIERGEVVRVASATSEMGVVTVGVTTCRERGGVCFVALADDEAGAITDLCGRYPGAEIESGDAVAAVHARRIAAWVDEPVGEIDVPLDARGTAFQHRVWAALRAIPIGTTKTYGGLARELGDERATRAVGLACGANPVSIVIPCHRVLSASGKLTGFYWGVERKAELLRRERAAVGSMLFA